MGHVGSVMAWIQWPTVTSSDQQWTPGGMPNVSLLLVTGWYELIKSRDYVARCVFTFNYTDSIRLDCYPICWPKRGKIYHKKEISHMYIINSTTRWTWIQLLHNMQGYACNIWVYCSNYIHLSCEYFVVWTTILSFSWYLYKQDKFIIF